MKATCYLRVAKSSRGFVFGATTKPSAAPLNSGSYGDVLVTRQFKLVLNLPDSAFREVDGVVEIAVPESVLSEVIAAEAEEVES